MKMEMTIAEVKTNADRIATATAALRRGNVLRRICCVTVML